MSLIGMEQPPIIEARGEEDLALAGLISGRIDPEELAARNDARALGIEALPFISRTEAGREFLSLPAPRALARGSPPEICPATGVAGGEGVADRRAAAVGAIEACLARLEGREGCGCRVIALDGLLTVPREDVSYATGTTARLRSEALGLDALLVAEDVGRGQTLLRDLRGPVGLLRHLPDDRAELRLAGERDGVFEGTSYPVGYRRGRVAERIYLSDGAGREISILIGFSPRELEDRAAAWLADPPAEAGPG